MENLWENVSQLNVQMSELISLMVGRDLGNYYVRTYNKPGDIMMEVKTLMQEKEQLTAASR